ncbi:MAG: hypothetical protein AAGF45_05540 [Pseudomonadota bacterium]
MTSVETAHPDGSVATSGPWPFVTLQSQRTGDHETIWYARAHRKGLQSPHASAPKIVTPFWQSATYNWTIGALFALGASLFLLGSTLTLIHIASGWTANSLISVTFFLGSIPFTGAAALQHFQSANAADFLQAPAGKVRRSKVHVLGWQAGSLGWLSTATQLLGTVAFNFNTFDAIDPPANWITQDLVIWLPGLAGAILFLVSGTLAYLEAGHAYFSWKPASLAWRITFVNLLGCIFFMAAGALSYVPEHPEPSWVQTAAVINLWIGALGFFVGALLLMRESRLPASP